MATACCRCSTPQPGATEGGLPLICLVPRDTAALGGAQKASGAPRPSPPRGHSDFTLLSEDYIKKNFKLGPQALYLDPWRRPLITFPLNQDNNCFNLAKKQKINQMILDGQLDGSEAITAPSVFPYAKSEAEKRKEIEKAEDEEIIYILQLPDWEFKCPVHNQTVRTPRFIWHSCKTKEAKSSDKSDGKGPKPGGGPMNRPKPWLLSRHTDFDMLSQW